GNGSDGVSILIGGIKNTIGGRPPVGKGNVISGNSGAGVSINGSDGLANGNSVEGNLIGTDFTGTKALANGSDGVVLLEDSFGNTIGGTVSGAANVIAFNLGNGVGIGTAFPNGNAILGNSIFSNGKLGIDLGLDGVTPNDPCDGDSGANKLQNHPVLTEALF